MEKELIFFFKNKINKPLIFVKDKQGYKDIIATSCGRVHNKLTVKIKYN